MSMPAAAARTRSTSSTDASYMALMRRRTASPSLVAYGTSIGYARSWYTAWSAIDVSAFWASEYPHMVHCPSPGLVYMSVRRECAPHITNSSLCLFQSPRLAASASLAHSRIAAKNSRDVTWLECTFFDACTRLELNVVSFSSSSSSPPMRERLKRAASSGAL
jgi:hypothetical protein